MPTATSTFSANARASVFFRIHQGGTAPLADAKTRAADHRFGLPLAQPDPGEYVVVFELRLGETVARRHVRFSVRPATGRD